jgi:hypothetical protein
MEWHLIDQPKAMHTTCGAVVPHIMGDTPGLVSRLHLPEQQGMVTFFDPENRGQMVVLERLHVRGIGTQTVFSDDELEVGVIVPQLGNKALGGMAFAIIVARAVLLHDRFRHQGNHGPHVWMDHRRASHLMGIRDCPVAVDLVQTRRTVHRLRGARARAIEGQYIAVLQEHHRFERLPSLSLGKHALEHRAERLGGDRIQDLTHVRVARDTLDPVDGVPIALGPLLVKGQERGRFEGKHREGGHEGICSRHIRLGRAMIWDVVKAGVHQPKERISREMFPSFGGNVRHRHPYRENVKAFT